GRHFEGQYHHFCLDHVRLYNRSYNYFAGMNDAAIAAYQKDAVTGHRPTWTMGVNSAGPTRAAPPGAAAEGPAGTRQGRVFMFGRSGFGAQAAAPEPEPRRKLRNLERRSLQALHLDAMATGPQIKARYKELVKRHHPDANGGDRSSEDRLQEIIQAYNYLK